MQAVADARLGVQQPGPGRVLLQFLPEPVAELFQELAVAAGQEGKWKTSLQLVGIISLCVHYVHPLDLGFRTVPVDYNLVGKALVYLSGAFSVWSAVVYFRAFLAMLAGRGGAAPDAKSV